jgi:MoxR-like ATPase
VGAGPRAAQALLLLAKVRALLAGRHAVAIEDLAAVAPCALRHRLQLSYEAEADRVDVDRVIAHLIEHTPQEAA